MNRPNESLHNDTTLTTSKQAYNTYVKSKFENIASMSVYLTHSCTLDDLSADHAFNEKLCKEKELKLREFNFKVMYNILSCNENLYRWKKRENPECDVCSLTQGIKHLLFECEYVKPLWLTFENVFNVQMNYGIIICGTKKQ